jgi:hypothetical protein
VRQPSLVQAALALFLLVTPSALGHTADNLPFARLVPERVAGDPAHENWGTPQFLQADGKGRIFLLHGDNLEVDQLLPSGKIVVWRKPRGGNAPAATASVSDAVMNPDGSSWLLLNPSESDEVNLLHGDDLRQLPAPRWWVSAMAYTGDGPVLAVLPVTVGGEDASTPSDPATWNKPPLLLRLHDQTWQTLAEQEPLNQHLKDSRDLHPKTMISPPQLKAERDTRLAPGLKGTLWVAQQNAYVLRRYSGFGTLEESVVVGGGKVQWKDRTEEDWKIMERSAGMKLDRTNLLKTHAVRVVRGMTAQDNRVYLVVETPQGLALDCWDAEAQALKRLLLAGIASDLRYLSLAAGRDGLYIAGRGLGEPIWRLDWQRLEGAKWKPVPEAIVQRPGTGKAASNSNH